MKKSRVIQFFLITVGIILFFITYHSGNKKQVVDIEKNTSIKDEALGELTRETSSIIENVNYVGTDNRGNFFDINANQAKVYEDKPNLSNMDMVNAVISLKDGRKIYIKSDYAIYNRLTNDAEFMGNVLITESNNVIKSDNLDLNISKNLISAYNNVHYSGTEGFLIADQVLINMLKNEANIFMFEKKDRVKVKYKN